MRVLPLSSPPAIPGGSLVVLLALAGCSKGGPGAGPESSASASAPSPAASSTAASSTPASSIAVDGDHHGELPWIHDDWSRAVAEARATKKPIVVDLWAPWCHTCISMQKTVFTEEAITSRASRFVWLALDTDRPENADALRHMAISAWPTFYVLSADEQQPLARHVGSATTEQLIAFLDEGALQAANTGGDDALAALVEADRLVTAGDRRGAVTAYQRALAAGGPTWLRRFEVRVELAETLLRLGDAEACVDLALAHLDDMGQAGSASGPDFVGVTAGCAERLDGPAKKKAMKLLERAAGPQNPIEAVLGDPKAELSADDRSDALRILREVNDALGKKEAARALAKRQQQILDEAVAGTDDIELLAGFAWPREEVYVYLGEGERLVPELQRIEEALPKSYDPPYRLAWLLREIGRLDEAAAAAERALALVYGPRKVQAYQLLASIEQRRKKKAEERAAWQGLLATVETLSEAEQARMSGAAAKAREALAALGPG